MNENQNPYASPREQGASHDVGGWHLMIAVAMCSHAMLGLLILADVSEMGVERVRIAVGGIAFFGLISSVFVTAVWLYGWTLIHESQLEPKEPTP